MFNYGDRVRINCTYFNDDVNGKKGICSWEDEKPISIEWLLGKKDKNE